MGLKSEIEALEAEISEVQDTFREKDAKEFKRVKWELGKSTAAAGALRNPSPQILDKSVCKLSFPS